MCSFSHSCVSQLGLGVEDKLKESLTDEAGPELVHPVQVVSTVKAATGSVS